MRVAVIAFAVFAFAASALAAERLIFDREVTLTAKETAFPPEFADLTAPLDFRDGTLHVRYDVKNLAATGRTVALQFCLKAPDGAHTCLPCVEVREPGVRTIERPLAKLFKSAPIAYDRLTAALLVAKAESCRNHDEPAGSLRAEYYPLNVRATAVAVSAGATFSGWENYAAAPTALAGAAAARSLEICWIDVEGGGATLLVTPAGESVLIDSGNPGGRDAGRIHRAAREAGLTRIDHYVTTHFHSDHCGGAAELAQLVEIGEVYDNGIPAGHPDGRAADPRWPLLAKAYREFKAHARHVLSAGEEIPLRQRAGSPDLRLRCLAARQKFADAPSGAMANPNCVETTRQPDDLTDNANSIVLLLEFGGFCFFVGGDLTWNTEGALVCPIDRVGTVDVFQVDHHGLDVSNNPVLVHTLAPKVAVISNGARKGAAAATFTTLRTSPGLQAIYQSHKCVRPDAGEQAPDECVANFDTVACAGNAICLTVAADARTYTVAIPATGHSRTFATHRP